MNNTSQLIHDEEKAKQLIAFDGMQYGSMYPTDIDGFMEYKDKCYVFYEVKKGNTGMKYGQRKAFERLVRDIGKSGKPAICILASHNVEVENGSIPLDECIVTKYYSTKSLAWIETKRRITAREVTDLFLEMIEGKEENANTSTDKRIQDSI